jgi:hypothetical protein
VGYEWGDLDIAGVWQYLAVIKKKGRKGKCDFILWAVIYIYIDSLRSSEAHTSVYIFVSWVQKSKANEMGGMAH